MKKDGEKTEVYPFKVTRSLEKMLHHKRVNVPQQQICQESNIPLTEKKKKITGICHSKMRRGEAKRKLEIQVLSS
jgi:hypothetical protein